MSFFSNILKKTKTEKWDPTCYNFINLAHQDILFPEAGRYLISKDNASIGMLQRYLKIGFNRSYRILQQLEKANVIEQEQGTKPRSILMTTDEFEWYLRNCPNDPELESEQSEIDIMEDTLISLKGSNVIDVDSISGEEFEKLCCWILSKIGYTNIQLTNSTGDKGVDIIATKDDVRYAIQCKCYSGGVGNSAVQQIFSGKSIYNADIAVVLTNSYFTNQAIEDANALRVRLWDRRKLKQLIQQIGADEQKNNANL